METKNEKTYFCLVMLSDPAGIQTQNPQIRNLMLYSVELQGLTVNS